jgi:hypothetical protein
MARLSRLAGEEAFPVHGRMGTGQLPGCT